MTAVVDASALLAFLQDEPGGAAVGAVIGEGVISAVNWSEVVQKAIAAGIDVAGLHAELASIGLATEPFTARHAEIAAGLWPQTRRLGLSLADRASLALARELGAVAWTADRAWSTLRIGVEVMVVR